jgi:hypothetical protein
VDVVEPIEIRVKTARAFARESALPGAVFRGQTADHGSLRPALYRGAFTGDVEALAELLSRYYIEVYDRVHELSHRGARYADGLERSRYPSLEWLFGSDAVEDAPGVRFEPPFHRTVLSFKAMTDPDARWELAELEAQDDILHWERFREESRFMDAYREAPFRLARLQHYGVPTSALDVTFDPYVALWFATHRFVRCGHQRGYYANSDRDGIVYVLSPPLHVVGDLRRTHVAPLGGLRAVRQEGGLLLGATETESDLSRFVVKKLIVPPNTLKPPVSHRRQRRRFRRFRQDYLFPSGSEDELYGTLLRDRTGPYEALTRWIVEYVQPSAA